MWKLMVPSLCLQGGMYMLQLMDAYVASYSVLTIAFTECLVLSYLYGKISLMSFRIFRDVFSYEPSIFLPTIKEFLFFTVYNKMKNVYSPAKNTTLKALNKHNLHEFPTTLHSGSAPDPVGSFFGPQILILTFIKFFFFLLMAKHIPDYWYCN